MKVNRTISESAVTPEYTIAYFTYERMVHYLAWKYSRLYGVPQEDLAQEGYLLFLQAQDTWRPSKSDFVTWFFITMKQGMYRFCRRWQGFNRGVPVLQDEKDHIEEIEEGERIAKLSPQSKTIIRVLIHWDVPRKRKISAMKSMLEKSGLRKKEIEEGCRELRLFLGGAK